MPFGFGRNKRESGGKEAGSKTESVTVRNPADKLSEQTIKDHQAAMQKRKTPKELSDLDNALVGALKSAFDTSSDDDDSEPALSRSLLSL